MRGRYLRELTGGGLCFERLPFQTIYAFPNHLQMSVAAGFAEIPPFETRLKVDLKHMKRR